MRSEDEIKLRREYFKGKLDGFNESKEYNRNDKIRLEVWIAALSYVLQEDNQ